MTRPTRVGSAELWPLVDAVGCLGELEQLFPGVARDAWAPYRERHPSLFSGPLWRLACTCFLIRSGGRTVLVDTGVGPAGLWGWQAESEERLLPALAATGVKPEDVDVVFLTHLHIDHVGWNTDRHGEVVFPSARYLAHSEGIAFTLASGRAHVDRCVGTLVERGLLDEAGEGDELAAGVTAVLLPGHYPGHMGVRIDGGSTGALLIADAAVHPLLLQEPELAYAFDADPAACTETRRQLLEEIVDRDVLVACGHYPDGGIGRVARRDDHVVWEPAA